MAFPDRQSVAFVGDGGFSMLMGEFATAVKYRLPIKVVVIKNNSLGMIKWEQMVFLGNPEYGCELQPIDFAGFARVCGGTGFTIEDPAECGRILDQALATPGPVIVEAGVDPFDDASQDNPGAGHQICVVTCAWRAEPGANRPHGTRG